MDELEKRAFVEIIMNDLGIKLAKHLTKGANVKIASNFNWGNFRNIAVEGMRKLGGIPLGVGKAPGMMSRFAHAAPHLNEVAGLGVLAAPSVAHLTGKPMEEDTSHAMEVGGLGMLAAPSVYHAAKSFMPKAGRMLGKLHA